MGEEYCCPICGHFAFIHRTGLRNLCFVFLPAIGGSEDLLFFTVVPERQSVTTRAKRGFPRTYCVKISRLQLVTFEAVSVTISSGQIYVRFLLIERIYFGTKKNILDTAEELAVILNEYLSFPFTRRRMDYFDGFQISVLG